MSKTPSSVFQLWCRFGAKLTKLQTPQAHRAHAKNHATRRRHIPHFSAVIPLMLLYLRQWKAALICIFGFLASTLGVGYIKVFVGRARPINDLYTGSESFSFPSGHMTNSTVVLGTLTVFLALTLTGLKQKLAVTIMIFLIHAIGFSRIYLGAHWPGDILGASLLGLSLIILIQLLIGWLNSQAWSKMDLRSILCVVGLAVFIWFTHVATNKKIPKYNTQTASTNLVKTSVSVELS